MDRRISPAFFSVGRFTLQTKKLCKQKNICISDTINYLFKKSWSLHYCISFLFIAKKVSGKK